MTDDPPTSVILSTVRPTPAIEEVATQLRPEDELLVVCDSVDDPIARREQELPEGVRLVLAGEPKGCSGKANAVAAGMEAAHHDRLVWTDDDFHHPPDWLERLQADYDRHGPVTELPVFVGRDVLSTLLEPLYALTGTLGIYATEKVWAGAVIFERDDLVVEEAAFLAALRRTVSDDGLLSEYLEVTPLRRSRQVEVGGTIRESLERHARFVQIVFRHEPRGTVLLSVLFTLITVGCLLFPLVGFTLSTLLLARVYAFLGVRRRTFLLAYPSFLLQVPLMAYALARQTFVWGGRRYRWTSKFDVTVEE